MGDQTGGAPGRDRRHPAPSDHDGRGGPTPPRPDPLTDRLTDPLPVPSDFLTDPSWYRDAVIYELHVRSFYDSNDDGYGDFAGLREKLPYLERLGVNTLWLLPFLQSPLRDDGYDTADYFTVLPVHGDLDDFKAFLDDAHSRGMRVITELVLNHTSDQHPWFQEARDPNSDKHDWYVWSNTTDKYKEARIIFTDTEVSNWTWDQKAGKYFWHRFFSHQPDLNYDNPEVRDEMKEVMAFWFDLGVDGLRLDAVPYLFEREGTSCENLPETIDYIVELRQSIEERFGPGKVLLAEANQWPEDTLPYFADGRGVQMSFNFPIMPRMYMALRRESRRPLVEMLELTADIPEGAQWATFLRNHDELTLEMVTDEERDYMNHEYAADARFRINVGIRRRLAPLLGGDRRQIELLNALLLSMPGSPVLYYGDEIGMGDDPFLGDRNGVRTPMQWSPDKNGGFSRAPHHRLFMPAIDRGPYSYEFVNAEDAEDDPHSLLHVMRRLLAVRSQHGKTFGRGSFRVLDVENQAVLAFEREHEGERILIVANLSRFAQSAMLPPDEDWAGLEPTELFSRSRFPQIGDQPYHLPLGPYGFFWFALTPAETETTPPASGREGEGGAAPEDLPTLRVAEGVENLLVRTMSDKRAVEALEERLADFVRGQRWFGSKGERTGAARVEDAVRMGRASGGAGHDVTYLALVQIAVGGEGGAHRERYLLPLSTVSGDEAQTVLDERPGAAVAWVEGPKGRALLYDATVGPDFWRDLVTWLGRGGKGRSLLGLYAGEVAGELKGATATEARPLTGEQSNSAAIVTTDRGDGLFVKLYRRLESGTNPEVELLTALSRTGVRFVPRVLGTATYQGAGSEPAAMAIVQEAVAPAEDGFSYAVEKAGQALGRLAGTAPPEGDDARAAWFDDTAPELLEAARTLGVRTADLHRALASSEGTDLAPEPATAEDAQRFVDRTRTELHQTRELLDASDLDLDRPAPDDFDRAAGRLGGAADPERRGHQIRVHGDYHLGQTLRAADEFYVLDFEGEPARLLAERRRRDDALRDVAGMLRSFGYAVQTALRRRDDDDETAAEVAVWADALTVAAENAFLDAYDHAAGDAAFRPSAAARADLLWAYLVQKAAYEVRYELNNRPDWAPVPLAGFRRLLSERGA